MVFNESEVDPVKNQITSELLRQRRKRFPTRAYKQMGINDTLSIDLADMGNFIEENDNIRFLLVAIDIFSKKLYVRPLKTKAMTEVTKKMESILKEIASPIGHILSDHGL